jgi:hypothetical protein
MVVILVLGIVVSVVGLAMLAAPGRLTTIERRLNSDRANAGIPAFWHGRMSARMRVAGAIGLVCGVGIILAAFAGGHHH